MKWAGRYSRTELRRACERLGVKRPVKVQAVRPGKGEFEVCPDCGVSHVKAQHWYDRFAGVHTVQVVLGELTIAEANESFLHELTHAAQAEKSKTEFDWRMYAAGGELLFGYENAPHEVEARRTAAELKDEFSIARAS
jgi:hypothetical protein